MTACLSDLGIKKGPGFDLDQALETSEKPARKHGPELDAFNILK